MFYLSSLKINKTIDSLEPKALTLNKKESVLKVREFNMKIANKESYASIQDYNNFDDFWAIKINFDHNYLEVDRAPFTVMEDAFLSRVHFLFTMLNLTQVLVIRKGVLVGIITKNDFLKKKRLTLSQSTSSSKPKTYDTEMSPISELSRLSRPPTSKINKDSDSPKFRIADDR